MKNGRFAFLLGAAAAACPGAQAAAQDAATPAPVLASGQDLSQLSIEELAQIGLRRIGALADGANEPPIPGYVGTGVRF